MGKIKKDYNMREKMVFHIEPLWEFCSDFTHFIIITLQLTPKAAVRISASSSQGAAAFDC